MQWASLEIQLGHGTIDENFLGCKIGKGMLL
jgi:hypothetical protein